MGGGGDERRGFEGWDGSLEGKADVEGRRLGLGLDDVRGGDLGRWELDGIRGLVMGGVMTTSGSDYKVVKGDREICGVDVSVFGLIIQLNQFMGLQFSALYQGPFFFLMGKSCVHCF